MLQLVKFTCSILSHPINWAWFNPCAHLRINKIERERKCRAEKKLPWRNAAVINHKSLLYLFCVWRTQQKSQKRVALRASRCAHFDLEPPSVWQIYLRCRARVKRHKFNLPRHVFYQLAKCLNCGCLWHNVALLNANSLCSEWRHYANKKFILNCAWILPAAWAVL